MLLIGRTPRLRADNFFNPMVHIFENDVEPSILVVHMIDKLQLIAKMHGEVEENVCQAWVCQKHACVSRKGKQMFLGLKEGITYVKMKKPRKKKSLVSSW
jgi:hypothetical protein